MPRFEQMGAGYTGGMAEAELIRSCQKFSGWDSKRWAEEDRGSQLKDLTHWVKEHLNIDRETWYNLEEEDQLQQLLWWVSQNQPEEWNPSDPRFMNTEGVMENKLASDLHQAIADGMGLDEEGLEYLKLYTALDTPADNLFHTDCFVEFGNIQLTIDITTNRAKADGKYLDRNHIKTPGWVLFLEDPGDTNEIILKGEEIGRYLYTLWKNKKEELAQQTVDA